MPRKRAFEGGAVAGALLVLALLAVLRSAQSAQPQSVPSTYDNGPNGYAAIYDLLRREGAAAQRFELPVAQLPRATHTLVVAGEHALDAAASSSSEQSVLDAWIRKGGRLVVLDSGVSAAAQRAFGMPAARKISEIRAARTACAFEKTLAPRAVAGAFTVSYARKCGATRADVFTAGAASLGVAYARGRGQITVIGTPSVFDNLHLVRPDNARIAYAVLGGAGTVEFDERVHGFAAGRSFWEVLPEPMRIAIFIAVGALLLAIAGANLPFAPPYAARPSGERDSGAYIDSLANMLDRGGAVQAAIARLRARCERVLAPRASGDERARMLLRELRTLESSPRPGRQDLVHAGRIFARVRKEYGS